MPNAQENLHWQLFSISRAAVRTGPAPLTAMPLTHAFDRRPAVTSKPAAEGHVRRAVVASSSQASAHPFGEINAYIAIRDRLLEKAESACTESNLDRAAGANDYVANCLRPARSPYEAQHLPEAEAARERKRCEAVKLRLARLRSTLADAA